MPDYNLRSPNSRRPKVLKARREPYWQSLREGQSIGFRRMPVSLAESWIARRWSTDRGNNKGEGYEFHAIGDVAAMKFKQACEAANAWFGLRDADIRTDEVVTVADACRRYVEERRKEKSQACAHDAEKRFERTVYGTPFGARALAKIRATQIKAWRDGLSLSPGGSNRTLTAIKAALNLAVRERNVDPAQAREWADVKPLPGGNKRRDLFLDREQRRALLAASSGAVRDLIEAAILTGARAGELVHARRNQLELRTGMLTLTGKTGTRTIALTPETLALFTRLAKDKTPLAYLLTRDDGKPWQHSDWDELVREAAEKAGLPKGTCLYTLRHSFITASLTGGVSTLAVKALVGTSLMMIEKHYGHLDADAVRDQLAKVQLL